LLLSAVLPTIGTIIPEPIIGRTLFTDGIVRPIFLDACGEQYVHDWQSRQIYGCWLTRPTTATSRCKFTSSAVSRPVSADPLVHVHNHVLVWVEPLRI
jgi:hypothetical protein